MNLKQPKYLYQLKTLQDRGQDQGQGRDQDRDQGH